MAVKVRLRKYALDYFRRLALKSNLELLVFLIGTVAKDTITVEEFVYPQGYDTQTPRMVQWRSDEYDALVARTAKSGKHIVGDIHSHPGYDAVMSKFDWETCEPDKVCGICAVYKVSKTTAVRFWMKDCALPCKVEYIKDK